MLAEEEGEPLTRSETTCYLLASLLSKLVTVGLLLSPFGIAALCLANSSFLFCVSMAASSIKWLPTTFLMSSEGKG